ncbi:hypothetical protein CHAN_09755 [Corynebacterium hansenii]|nr:hypothetical protein CHAN_09755 [Corynebacterium hansenii]
MEIAQAESDSGWVCAFGVGSPMRPGEGAVAGRVNPAEAAHSPTGRDR